MERDEQLRVISYLKDYNGYLWNKQEREHSGIVQVMIRNTVADIKRLVAKLEEDLNNEL